MTAIYTNYDDRLPRLKGQAFFVAVINLKVLRERAL